MEDRKAQVDGTEDKETFKARMVAAKQHPGIPSVQHIQNWAYQAKKAAGQPIRKTKRPAANPAATASVGSDGVYKVGGDGRRYYTAEFKAEAVRRYREAKEADPRGVDMEQVAQALGISKTVLGAWNIRTKIKGPVPSSQQGDKQIALFDPDAPAPAVNHVPQHVTPQSFERMKNELAKLHEKCTILEEDNALLRGMATVAQRRGYLNLFGNSGTKKGDGQ